MVENNKIFNSRVDACRLTGRNTDNIALIWGYMGLYENYGDRKNIVDKAHKHKYN